MCWRACHEYFLVVSIVVVVVFVSGAVMSTEQSSERPPYGGAVTLLTTLDLSPVILFRSRQCVCIMLVCVCVCVCLCVCLCLCVCYCVYGAHRYNERFMVSGGPAGDVRVWEVCPHSHRRMHTRTHTVLGGGG